MGIFSLFIESCLIRIASFMYAVNMGAFKSQVELYLSQDLQTVCHVTPDLCNFDEIFTHFLRQLTSCCEQTIA